MYIRLILNPQITKKQNEVSRFRRNAATVIAPDLLHLLAPE